MIEFTITWKWKESKLCKINFCLSSGTLIRCFGKNKQNLYLVLMPRGVEGGSQRQLCGDDFFTKHLSKHEIFAIGKAPSPPAADNNAFIWKDVFQMCHLCL